VAGLLTGGEEPRSTDGVFPARESFVCLLRLPLWDASLLPPEVEEAELREEKSLHRPARPWRQPDEHSACQTHRRP